MRILIAIAALAAASACTTVNEYGETVSNNTGTGILAGAVGGAVLGTAAGGNDGRNAIVGAIVGGLAGGLVGNYMDIQQERLRAQLRDTEVEVIRTAEDEILLRLPAGVTFDTDRATVKSQFLPTLTEVASTLAEYPQTLVDVTGHADSTGTDAHNQTLSENRAFAVSSVLINNGVRRERIVANGRGETSPIASNDTADGRLQNRRVEIRLKAVRA